MIDELPLGVCLGGVLTAGKFCALPKAANKVTIWLQVIAWEGVHFMIKRTISIAFALCLLITQSPIVHAISMDINNQSATQIVTLYHSTAYVPIRTATDLLCPEAMVSWVNGQAVVTKEHLRLSARPGDFYLEANGRMFYIKDGVKLINGSTMVPIRVLSRALGALVSWDSATQTAVVRAGSGTVLPGEEYYDSASVYWLSRIINAESAGEPLKGKIAVGNVVLNRVKSPEFPSSIYDVIFDTQGGVQFEPTKNGTIHGIPNEESILAAKLCLDGAVVVKNSQYFLNVHRATSLWIVNNCKYISTIGNHQFYE